MEEEVCFGYLLPGWIGRRKCEIEDMFEGAFVSDSAIWNLRIYWEAVGAIV